MKYPRAFSITKTCAPGENTLPEPYPRARKGIPSTAAPPYSNLLVSPKGENHGQQGPGFPGNGLGMLGSGSGV